ncbi:hypothetical protein B0I33_106147 [Prauserella shujinwangii]|uniref:YCII-related domain-containing protein n=1 Tax=Prauserella shujinwangii TaxID=1453103 RepID=A0A2T0LTI9_9PSEU|nr:hypothetical protein B0I33_106147 [Prauserella shujinwangii]
MRYMVLLYNCDWSPEGSAEYAAKRDAVLDYVAMLRERGVFRGADPLQGAHAATTVRVRDGERLVTDGPFAESHEWLAGYFLLECRDLDEALELAAACPMASDAGVEVRPVRAVPGWYDPADRLREVLAE